MDQSNIEHPDGRERVLLLPVDSDSSAEQIRLYIKQELDVNVGVIINDSMGRAWRNGTLGLAIGVAGFTSLENYVGGQDIFGRELVVTEVAAADEMAAGASLVMGQTQEKTPVVLVRGYQPRDPSDPTQQGVKPLLRPKELDLFR
jgi:coenzyme F420-0:L-glutamate ligase/coenzyme F420-1:gamma-L-glutamate ligase